MKIAAHIEKFRRFDALRSRFDPQSEFELWYWMSLSAGTALINAALHKAAITREHHSFATQVEHVYLVVEPDGSSRNAILRAVDIIHVGMPGITVQLPPPIAEAFAAMEIIEKYRDPCIRADHPIDRKVIETCSAAFAKCVSAASRILAPLPVAVS
jgi:hypothetical protein